MRPALRQVIRSQAKPLLFAPGTKAGSALPTSASPEQVVLTYQSAPHGQLLLPSCLHAAAEVDMTSQPRKPPRSLPSTRPDEPSTSAHHSGRGRGAARDVMAGLPGGDSSRAERSCRHQEPARLRHFW